MVGSCEKASRYTAPFHRPRNHDAAIPPCEIFFADGPYPDDKAGREYLAEKLVGRVVGILQPSFEEPKLAAARLPKA